MALGWMDHLPIESQRERFQQHIKQDENGCWIWQGCQRQTAKGLPYGTVKAYRADGRRVSASAHRVAFALWCGPIPEGTFILHTCDNPLCVNPEHLVPGTHQENMDAMREKGRSAGARQRQMENLLADLGILCKDIQEDPDITYDIDWSYWITRIQATLAE